MINNKLLSDLKKLDVDVVCVTKNAQINQMRSLYEFGFNTFGENYVQSFLQKYDELFDLDIQWHFIGHLQTNKVAKMINKIDCLHSLDSLNLAKYIEKYRELPLDCFIEININGEDSKSGINLNNLVSFLDDLKKFPKVNPIGLMVMGVDGDLKRTEYGFNEAMQMRDTLISNGYNISKLSMGMSDDYLLAMQYQSTHIRLGRILFRSENDGII